MTKENPMPTRTAPADTHQERWTAKQFLALIGADLPEKDDLLALGARAARLAATADLQPAKVHEEEFKVHTWPREIWEKAHAGEQAPARPASQKQIAYMAILWFRTYPDKDLSSLLDYLDREMDEDEAGRRIDDMRRHLSGLPPIDRPE